jgi:hypothetical protein
MIIWFAGDMLELLVVEVNRWKYSFSQQDRHASKLASQ